MVLVTLGTQDKPFTRLLDGVEKAVREGDITEPVIVQAGHTPYHSDDLEVFGLIDGPRLEQYVRECSLLITHGGVGSIMAGLRNHKKVIAMARLTRYGEHESDHQIQIVGELSRQGYILAADDAGRLGELCRAARDFQPRPYVSNTPRMMERNARFIAEDAARRAD
jgi:UDP-N-acetylglucosamine transferase subunit ALG13